jgi:antitoxin ParD1/3/4
MLSQADARRRRGSRTLGKVCHGRYTVGKATRNISLTREQDAFIAKVVKSGEYQNASEAVRDALRALQLRRKEDALKLKALREQLAIGIAAIDRGDFIDVEQADLGSYLKGLRRARTRRR